MLQYHYECQTQFKSCLGASLCLPGCKVRLQLGMAQAGSLINLQRLAGLPDLALQSCHTLMCVWMSPLILEPSYQLLLLLDAMLNCFKYCFHLITTTACVQWTRNEELLLEEGAKYFWSHSQLWIVCTAGSLVGWDQIAKMTFACSNLPALGKTESLNLSQQQSCYPAMDPKKQVEKFKILSCHLNNLQRTKCWSSFSDLVFFDVLNNSIREHSA